MTDTPLCRRLAWDSEFFGFPVARVERESLDSETAAAALDWCRRERIRCLYFLSSTEPASVRAAEASRFHLVDVRMTLKHSLDDAAAAARRAPVRTFRLSDVDALVAIVRTSFHDTRFFRDAGFPRDRAARLYEVWIEQACAGAAETVLVAPSDGAPGGFISCHLDSSGAARIGLVGVADEAQGLGLGRHLVQGAVEYFARGGATQATVVTQGQNVRALSVYQRCGFRTSATELWYHRWFD